MRFVRVMTAVVAMAGALGFGCGREEAPAPADEVGSQSQALDTWEIQDRWCRSYKSQYYCPKSPCVWNTYPAPGYCSMPARE